MATHPTASAVSPAHTAAHQALHEGIEHSHAALEQVRQLEMELRVRKSLLKATLTNDLQQRAAGLKMTNAQDDIAKLVDDIIG
ncbi:hypothetical protein [Bradyrhizobium sp. Ai1a-2]|uniref:hypothetical protein n=1 Tax=Bradyrhizobium sp. Ai1a-2 TaxID=196490 RepID=UPI0003F5A545|nr:hypothetical protein [Bradyrhizobium sp. Ai1a-2]